MSGREFLQLAHVYKGQAIGGWYVSEKLDGMRAYWDGGWTRGILTSRIPFANTFKDYRRVTPPRSTGLWSRYGNPIAAPDEWLDTLPRFPLDGELYLGPNRFQETISIVKRYTPDADDWASVRYMVFDLPSDYAFLAPGKINNPQWTIELPDMRDLAPTRLHGPMNFHKVCRMIELNKILLTGHAVWVKQKRLPMTTRHAIEMCGMMQERVVEEGGEGLVLRKPESIWEPKRTWNCLKMKQKHDSEATVVGFIWGKGKLDGLMGAMIVEWQGKQFELSGFTDEERWLYTKEPGFDPREPSEIANSDTYSRKFPIGSRVTFHYASLTNEGIPREARFWRKDCA